MRIAIVGSGVSGLVAAHLLHPKHDITMFEADDRIGGHVHTWNINTDNGSLAIDSGFIVYNNRNYPHFSRLLNELDVPTQSSAMSFSVRDDNSGIEYNGSTLGQLFVQKRNLLRPRFVRTIAEILRFNSEAVTRVQSGVSTLTLRELLNEGGYSRAFREWYLLPMGSAIWSISPDTVLDMPARFFVNFFHNHGMLTVNDRPEWRVVQGGSARYVDALVAPFRDRVRLNHRVLLVTRHEDFVQVDGEAFDRVVLACHSDQSLGMLSDATVAEREVLRAFPYQVNDAVLHTDASVLPKSRAAWGAWNYRVASDQESPAVVTYNMNILQSLKATETYCVTLNGEQYIDPGKVLGQVRYHHPIFATGSTTARARRSQVSGVNRTHYCGAYWGNGFHEDGVASAMVAVSEIEVGAREVGAHERHATLVAR